MTEEFKKQIETEARQAVTELLAQAKLKKGDVFVVGCSSSEIVGGHIGKDSSLEAAQAVYAGVAPVLAENGIWLAAQCCEHLNRAIIIEREAAEKYGWEEVCVVPRAPAPRGRQLGHHLLEAVQRPHRGGGDPRPRRHRHRRHPHRNASAPGGCAGAAEPFEDRRGQHSLRPHPPEAHRRRARKIYRGGLSLMAEKNLEEMREAVEAIREKMAAAAREAGRDPAEVQLCAACKTRTADTVAASAALAIDVFGENHVQELCANYDAGAYCGKPSHFIGHLQTNKIKKVLGRASLIQSVDSEHLLAAIEKEAAKAGIVQDVLLEVNIGGEESKSGVSPEQLWPLLDAAAAEEHIRVKGLMAIPPVNDDDAQNRRYLAQVYKLFVQAGERGYQNVKMETLSMGMSGDFENAIREGATLVRIGTAIYGERDYSKK